MGALHRPLRHHQFQEYLTLCEDSNVRLEYWGGEIFAMAGGSIEHSRLSLRIGSLLDLRRQAGCVALESNIRIRPLTSDRATYADAVLIRGEYAYHPDDPARQTIANPAVVVEVLSESTSEDDQTSQFDHYKLAPSLADYVLVWQDQPRVEVRSPHADGWLVRTYGPGQTVELHAGIQFTVDELYAR